MIRPCKKWYVFVVEVCHNGEGHLISPSPLGMKMNGSPVVALTGKRSQLGQDFSIWMVRRLDIIFLVIVVFATRYIEEFGD